MKRIYAILMLVTIWMSFIPAVHAETPQFIVTERLGTTKQAVVVSDEVIQVELVIENRGADFDGTVTWTNDLYIYDNAAIQSLSIRRGETKTIRFNALFSNRNAAADTITKSTHLTFKTKEGQTIPYRNTLVPMPRLNDRSYIYFGLLTNTPAQLAYFNQLGKIGEANGTVAEEVSLNALRESRFSLHSFDYVAIDNYDLSQLDEKQQEHLLYYIKTGGTVLLGYERYDVSMLKPFAPLLDFANESVAGTAKTITLERQAKAKLKLNGTNISKDDSVIVTRQRLGLGAVVQYPFSFSQRRFSSNLANYSFLTTTVQHVLNEGGDRARLGSSLEYQVTRPMRHVERTMFNPTNFIVGGGLYIVFISFGVYFVLKRTKRLTYAWFIIPIGSLLMTLLLFTLGASDRLKGIKVQNAQILLLDRQEGYGYGSISLFSDREGDVEMKQKQQFFWPFREPVFNRTDAEYPFVSETTNDRQTLTYNNVALWSVVQAAGVRIEQNAGEFKTDLTFKGDRLVGTIRNETKWNVDELYMLNGNSVIPLPPLKKGATLRVDAVNPDKTTFYPQAPLGVEMKNLYYRDRVPLKANTEKEIDRWKRDQLLNGAYSNFKLRSIFGKVKQPMLLALSKDDYELATYNRKVGETTSYTLAMQPQTIKGKAEGPYRIRLVFGRVSELKGSINYVSENADSTTFQAERGEYAVVYDLPSFFANTKVKSLIVTIPKTKRRSFSIYNFKTNQYEPLKDKVVFRIKNGENYTVDQKFKLKVTVEDERTEHERDDRVPTVTVEGDVQ